MLYAQWPHSISVYISMSPIYCNFEDRFCTILWKSSRPIRGNFPTSPKICVPQFRKYGLLRQLWRTFRTTGHDQDEPLIGLIRKTSAQWCRMTAMALKFLSEDNICFSVSTLESLLEQYCFLKKKINLEHRLFFPFCTAVQPGWR